MVRGADPVGWETAKSWAFIIAAAAVAASALLLALLPKPAGAAALIPFGVALLAWWSRWRVAKPDEWLLVLRDGQLIGQGIGLRAFCGWRDSIAKFPATIQKIRFQATQVDREMQGLEVSGYLSWSVNRDGEGPWNAYKYMAMRDLDGDGTVDSDKGSQHIAEMAKAVVRSHVANSSLQEVLTQREAFRAQVKAKLMEQVQGWGVWVEAIEIADVRICSTKLFEDLQASHRQQVRLQAEEARLATERHLQERKLQDAVKLSKAQAEADAEQRLAAARQRLRAEQEEAELFAVQAEAAKARLRMEEEIELARIAKENRVDKQRALAKAEVARIEREAEMERLRMKHEVEGQMPETSLKCLSMQNAVEICEKLPLRDVRLNMFGDSDSKNVVSKLLPAAMSLASWDVVEDKGK
mmetsp:Transcript_28906/g.54214  ORF Transcript_28906/g.54214 Transcript_28906/m.54214 type:complete len:411 (+) Transcript_28906:73-1305(+)